MEKLIERLLPASRWILAPVYLGLSLGLLALALKFFVEIYHMFHLLVDMSEADLVLRLLSLVDLTLVGGLIVMVMFSGYENFVSKIDSHDDGEKLGSLTKMDSSTLKLKVAASIVAISSIHLLRIFVEVQNTANDKLLWYVVLHLTFVVSAVLLGVLDRMSFSSHRGGSKEH
jgi:uncharacterized protein (TIGR00645 family)